MDKKEILKKARYRGHGLFRQRWISICSKHLIYESACAICNAGAWYNVVGLRIDNVIWKISADAWRWKANKLWKKPIKEQIAEVKSMRASMRSGGYR
jgi:hypothetical protein